MKAKAIQRNIHISSRKADLVCALIRGKKVAQAITILKNTDKKAARIILKVLNSAIANSTNNHSMSAETLFVYEAYANQGKTIKRMIPRAKGSSNVIRKRHCHIEVILSDNPKQRSEDLLAIKAKIANKKQGKSKEFKAQKEVTKVARVTSKSTNKPKIAKKQVETVKEEK